MKKMVLTLIALASWLAASGRPVSAQVIDSLEFKVPFDFTVSEKTKRNADAVDPEWLADYKPAKGKK